MSRVQLTHPQFYSFTEWLKANAKELFAAPIGYKDLALKGQDALGFAISDSAVKTALATTRLIEQYQAANGRAQASADSKAARLLAQQMKVICVRLGIELLPGLEELAK
jgi:hypothetical protein